MYTNNSDDKSLNADPNTTVFQLTLAGNPLQRLIHRRNIRRQGFKMGVFHNVHHIGADPVIPAHSCELPWSVDIAWWGRLAQTLKLYIPPTTM